MAKEQNLTGTDAVFQGTDLALPCHIKNAAETTSIDITGWTLSWMVKRYRSDADLSALITKTTSGGIAIAGSFNSDPDINTQRATVTIEDTDSISLSPGLYFHELKRTTNGAETVLIYGTFDLKEAVHR